MKKGYLLIAFLIMALVVTTASATLLFFQVEAANTVLEVQSSIKNRHDIIYIDKEVDTVLTSLYTATVNEFAGCLYGTVDDKSVNITRFQETPNIERNAENVTFIRCPLDAIMTIHSHPSGYCRLSEEDKVLFKSHDYLVVVCNNANYGIFHRDMPDIKIRYKIV